MEKELIINATNSEVEIALLENGVLTELHFQKTSNNFVVGDVFLGQVKKLVPVNMNAAFVDIGHKRDAFLHYTDLGPQIRSLIKYTNSTHSGSNNTYLLDNFKLEQDIVKTGRVDHVLAKKQNILVQVLKEPISTKGHRLTCEITLPGRYLVLSPFNNIVAVSKKIPNQEERNRLSEILESIKPKYFGVIARTAAEGKKVSELQEEMALMLAKWEKIYQKTRGAKPPIKVLSEIDKTSSVLRDLLNDNFNKIIVNDKEIYYNIKSYIESISPDQVKILNLYKDGRPIFDTYGVTRQIKSGFGKTVTLKSGAYLVIETTEAMHVIDVNSGHKVSGINADSEAALLATNIEAAIEIARQIRLRDIGGLIVIDFIDMKNVEHKKELYNIVLDQMSKDRAQHTILPLSKFGLMQITRQRVRPEIKINTSEICASCNGTGKVNPSILITEEIERNLKFIINSRTKDASVQLHVHPYIYAYFTNGLMSIQRKWFFKYFKWIKINSKIDFHINEYKFFDENQDEIRL